MPPALDVKEVTATVAVGPAPPDRYEIRHRGEVLNTVSSGPLEAIRPIIIVPSVISG